ncbi:MAG: hypothetical protein BWX68_03013 [Verrucomicrobia bacterium ADurb.Bin063]|jgi:hypothetical protein|nr:MAG: hypothetical protein BWX68_03013 [Verrucomicrobia bacterium ADurb.Bin063]
MNKQRDYKPIPSLPPNQRSFAFAEKTTLTLTGYTPAILNSLLKAGQRPALRTPARFGGSMNKQRDYNPYTGLSSQPGRANPRQKTMLTITGL